MGVWGKSYQQPPNFYVSFVMNLGKLGIYEKIASKTPIFFEILGVAKTKIPIHPKSRRNEEICR